MSKKNVERRFLLRLFFTFDIFFDIFSVNRTNILRIYMSSKGKREREKKKGKDLNEAIHST